MQHCEPFVESKGITWYGVLLNILAVAGFIFNIFVCYCIMSLSPKIMSSYRWYLLWHQIMTGFTDITYNFIARPVVFCPFQMGYTESIFRDYISAHHLCILCITSSLLSQSAVQHLFIYRQMKIQGYDDFPGIYKVRVAVSYILALLCGFMLNLCYGDMEAILENESKKFSCVTKGLLKITNFLVYDQWAITYKLGPVAAIFVLDAFIECFYCIISSIRNTSTATMSPQLIRLQRKLFIQLCFQAFVPITFVGIPFLYHNVIVYFKVFKFGMVIGHVLIANLSSYSLVGGIVLVMMNPPYQKLPRRKSARITVTPKSQTFK